MYIIIRAIIFPNDDDIDFHMISSYSCLELALEDMSFLERQKKKLNTDKEYYHIVFKINQKYNITEFTKDKVRCVSPLKKERIVWEFFMNNFEYHRQIHNIEFVPDPI